MEGSKAIWIAVVAMMVAHCSSAFTLEAGNDAAEDQGKAADDDKSRQSIFNVVRFRNEPCLGTTGRNGTCYTSDECANKGGVSSGSCASGFGVCCVFTVGCGATVSENCTYFLSDTVVAPGQCRIKVCKISNDICQLRLDFNTFVITGPNTRTASVTKVLGGEASTKGVVSSDATQCQTDIFTVTGPPGNSPPAICGTNTGEHMYVNALDSCNELSFQLGTVGLQAVIPRRQWSIKISQIGCDSNVIAPDGCTQYYYGSTTGIVRSYNFNGAPAFHLANQRQKICVRREANTCRICWFAAVGTDVQLSNKTNVVKGLVDNSLCCGYGSDGAATKGYDCIIIPGATKKTLPAAPNPPDVVPNQICGRSAGLVTIHSMAVDMTKTVCSMRAPFELEFYSDTFEMAPAANAETLKNAGFRLSYALQNC